MTMKPRTIVRVVGCLPFYPALHSSCFNPEDRDGSSFYIKGAKLISAERVLGRGGTDREPVRRRARLP